MKLTRLMILALLLPLIGGCFFRTRSHGHNRSRTVVRCGPGTYWDGHKCKKEKKHDRDHDRGRHRGHDH